MKILTIIATILFLFNANSSIACTQFASEELKINNQLAGHTINLNTNCMIKNSSIQYLILSLLSKNIDKYQQMILTREINNIDLSNINTFSNNLNSVVQAYGLSAIMENNKLYLYKNIYLLSELSTGETIYNLQPNYIIEDLK